MGPTPLHMPARTSPNVHSAIPVKPRSMPIFSPPLGATNPGQNPRPSDPSPFKSGLFIPCLTKALHFNVQTNPRPSRDPHALILKKSLHLKRETGNGLGHPGGTAVGAGIAICLPLWATWRHTVGRGISTAAQAFSAV